MERDLGIFYKHTEDHIVDEIKKKHPQWVTNDGFCVKCVDHFKRSLTGTAEAAQASMASVRLVNLGTKEGQKRFWLGTIATVAAAVLFAGLCAQGQSKMVGAILFPLFFGAFVGFLQARANVCVVLAAKGVRNLDEGDKPVTNPLEAEALKRASNKILWLSVIGAAVMTLICSMFLN